MRSNRSWEFLAPIVVFLSAMCSSACTDRPTLDVALINCSEVRRGPVCVVGAETQELRLFVQTTAKAKIRVDSDTGPMRPVCGDSDKPSEHCDAVAGGNVLRVPLQHLRGAVRITVKTPEQFGSSSYKLLLEPPVPPARWLTQVRSLWIEEGRLDDALEALQQTLRTNLPIAEQAQAHSIRAQVLQEQLRLSDALSAVQTAVRLDEQAGLMSGKSADLFVWADLLYDLRNTFELQRLLGENQAHFSLLAVDRPWLALYRAQAQQALGKYDTALLHVEEAEAWNPCCGNKKTIAMAQVLRASILSDLGRAREDEVIRTATDQLKGYPCRLGLLLRRQALLRLQVLESELGESLSVVASALADGMQFQALSSEPGLSENPPQTSPSAKEQRLIALYKLWAPGTPAAPGPILPQHEKRIAEMLDRSFAVLNGELPVDTADRQSGTGPNKCPILRHIILVKLTQARLAVLMRRFDQAKGLLDSVQRSLERKAQPEQAPVFAAEWNRLSAAVARAENRHADALAIINRLESLPGNDVASYEIRWSLYMGRAQALLGMRTAARKEILDALWAADAVLEEASRNVPQLFGRGSLFGRFEGSSRLLVEQLLDVGPEGVVHAPQVERALALRMIRHFRTRALLEMRRGELQLDETKQSGWSRAESEYLRARYRLDRARSLNEPKEQLRILEERARKSLAAALEYLGESGSPEQRPPAADELILTCYPLSQRWACLAADAEHIEAATLEAGIFDEPRAKDKIARALLSVFRPQLLATKGKVLSVLGYGSFRDVPVHLLPFEDGPLELWLTVRYPLDMGPLRLAPGSRSAVIAIDSTLEFADPREGKIPIANPILAALTSTPSWRPVLHELGYHGGPEGRPKSASSDELRRSMVSAGLLFIFGHANYAPANGWINAIEWSPWNRLTGGDVLLLLRRVPARVVIIACSSGAGSDVIGGQESLGIAQAFLLSGSQEVLSTTRDVTVLAGGIVARKLAEYLAAHPDDSLNAALKWTLTSLTLSNSDISAAASHESSESEFQQLLRIQSDLDAFRVLSR